MFMNNGFRIPLRWGRRFRKTWLQMYGGQDVRVDRDLWAGAFAINNCLDCIFKGRVPLLSRV